MATRNCISPSNSLVAASNELPAQGEGLEALWDRFLIRILCTCVKQEESFYKMLLDDSADHPETTACEWQISDASMPNGKLRYAA